MVTIVIEAPDDVDVIEIGRGERAVKKGEQIVKLRSLALEQLRLRIEFILSTLEIMERPFSDGRIEAQISQLEGKTERLRLIYDRDTLEMARRNAVYSIDDPSHSVENPPGIDISRMILIPVKSKTTGSSVGLSEPVDSSRAGSTKGIIKQESHQQSETVSEMLSPEYRPDYELKQTYERSRIAYEEALLQSSQARLNHKDALDKLILIRSKVKEYQEIYEAKRAQLTISAPDNGVFVPRIGANGFARKGHTLGELRYEHL